MSKDVRDALLIGGFFIGYAIVLALASRVPVPKRISIPLDGNRLAFGRSQRARLIAEENAFGDGILAGFGAITNDLNGD